MCPIFERRKIGRDRNVLCSGENQYARRKMEMGAKIEKKIQSLNESVRQVSNNCTKRKFWI